MKIGLRGGHSPNCKGTMSLRDEQQTMRTLYVHVRDLLVAAGHTVINCNSDANSQSGELSDGVNNANANGCDVYVTLHMNAFNGETRGVEAWCYNNTGNIAKQIASRFVDNVAALKIPNRGIKYSTGYYDLRQTKMPAVILEYLFCDNADDIDIWAKTSWDNLARKVANAIDPNIAVNTPEAPKPEPTPNPGGNGTMYRVVCGSFSSRDNAEARKKELEAKGFTGVFLTTV